MQIETGHFPKMVNCRRILLPGIFGNSIFVRNINHDYPGVGSFDNLKLPAALGNIYGIALSDVLYAPIAAGEDVTRCSLS